MNGLLKEVLVLLPKVNDGARIQLNHYPNGEFEGVTSLIKAELEIILANVKFYEVDPVFDNQVRLDEYSLAIQTLYDVIDYNTEDVEGFLEISSYIRPYYNVYFKMDEEKNITFKLGEHVKKVKYIVDINKPEIRLSTDGEALLGALVPSIVNGRNSSELVGNIVKVGRMALGVK